MWLATILEIVKQLGILLVEWFKRIGTLSFRLEEVRKDYEERRARIRAALFKRRARDILRELERIKSKAGGASTGGSVPTTPGERLVDDLRGRVVRRARPGEPSDSGT